MLSNEGRLLLAPERRGFLAKAMGTIALGASLCEQQPACAQPSPPLTPPTEPSHAGSVNVELKGPVLMIGFNRPPGNLLDASVFVGLGTALHRLERDDSLRVGVMYAEGPDFSVGADVASLAAAQRTGEFPPKDGFISPLGLRPPYRTKPLIVAVQGQTRYGGHELFLAADIRVAAADSVFNQGEVTRGVFPGGGATIRLPREAGWGNAMRYMLTGDDWGADEALRMGLAQMVVPTGKQIDRAVELASRVAAAAPLGVRATLASARSAMTQEDAAFASLSAEFGRLAQSVDRREALQAAQEGRRPTFRGY
jgi:enoyl-CoA hydratase/carnithine racemase